MNHPPLLRDLAEATEPLGTSVPLSATRGHGITCARNPCRLAEQAGAVSREPRATFGLFGPGPLGGGSNKTIV